MKNSLFKKVLIFTIISNFTLLSSFGAAYYYDDNSVNYSDNPDVNKFIPQSGVKVKESKMAAWMENSTRNAMNGNKQPKSQSKQIQNQRRSNNTGAYQKTYKWF